MVIREIVKRLPLIILLLAVGCESLADEPVSDTVEAPLSLAATLNQPALATRALRDLPTAAPTFTPSSTAAPTSTVTPRPVTSTPLPATSVPAIPPTLVSLASAASQQPAAIYAEFVFGTSVEGRELRGYRIGTGERVLLLAGAVHGGFEANTSALIEQLAAYFRANPAALLPEISLILIPAVNPDGLARGRVLEGRFNANGVDLNRNWGCEWEPVAYFRDQVVSAGESPFSEPETAALSALIQRVQPSAVLFYHGAAAGVFAGNCGGDSGSAALSETYGVAAEYAYESDFSRYPVTGTGPAWVNSLGIPSADVELASATDPEFDRNLRGVMAVQYWLAGR